MPDWTTSFFPHKCDYCGKKIKRKTLHIATYFFEGGVDERFCDPHCMCMEYETRRKIIEERTRLDKLRRGGEE